MTDCSVEPKELQNSATKRHKELKPAREWAKLDPIHRTMSDMFSEVWTGYWESQRWRTERGRRNPHVWKQQKIELEWLAGPRS